MSSLYRYFKRFCEYLPEMGGKISQCRVVSSLAIIMPTALAGRGAGRQRICMDGLIYGFITPWRQGYGRKYLIYCLLGRCGDQWDSSDSSPPEGWLITRDSTVV
ncbi:hypothetical protein Lspi_1054 [Legionella spiritensis]|uniref:Uncharacterized protein n=1 Tax=Legionella spiritensis TaxID=452 RepID=A0A0W0Z6Y9_LEGSP|nr:hypothetical protein Lspi_1054 [Legionella spiritensis]SNV41135.1 Uncharacterised protein [Legionella spiritensis]